MYDDHNAEVKIAGRSHPVNHHDPRQAAIALIAERAGQLGRPVKATAVDSDGSSWPLVIHPDGTVDAIEVAPKSKPIWPIVAAAGLAVVLIGGTAGYLLFGREPAKPKAPVAKMLPELPMPKIVPDQFIARPAPPGWTTNASWTIDIAEGSAPVVSPDGSEVAVLTEDQKLVVLDSNGKVLWQDEVPRDANDPVYTTIDSKPVLAVATPKVLRYYPGDGVEPTELDLPDGADVQFFGSSPLVTFSGEGASVVSNGDLHTVEGRPRFSTVLLAEGDKALLARYAGPLYWSQAGKDLQQLALKPPPGATGINHIAMASAGRALVVWNTKKANDVIPTVSSTADGSVAAACPTVDLNRVENWKWVPDQTGKVAAYGECVIDFTGRKTSLLEDFDPLSITGTTIYANYGGALSSIVPGGGKLTPLPKNAARPWGLAGNRAIVVHGTVLYALDKK
nr:hypothetical protein [Kribbella italica]